jgi:hypothetical protein
MTSVISMFVAAVLAATAPVPADLKARAEAVITIDRNQRGGPGETAAAIRESFRRIGEHELEPALLKTYDTRTLEVLFEAVAIASDRAGQPNLLTVLENIFQECVSRGFVGNMIDPLYRRYIEARELDKARKLYERFPSRLRELPDIIEPEAGRKEGPAVYTISEDGRTLTYTPVDLIGPMIVSVVSPGCHFSVDVVAAIESDPRLSRLFIDHAVNIDPAPYSLDAEALARVNRRGKFRYDILYRESGWKGFTFSTTPRFFFVRDGKIVCTLDDVTPQNLRARIAEGLKKIGLSFE